MEAEPPLQRFEILRVFGKFGEQLHLDGAQKRFRSPESKAYLQNVIGLWLVHCVPASGQSCSITGARQFGNWGLGWQLA
jgi:hypothetical protein